MNIPQLSNELERQYELIGAEGWGNIYDDINCNFPLILKSLRFAADMERLLRIGVVTIHPVDSHFSHYTVAVGGKGVHGDDAYTAARKAVEKLEGK